MRLHRVAVLFFSIVALPLCMEADDAASVRKAVLRSTLNQPGTQPFHLKAELAPSLEQEKDSGRTGEVEIWWASPIRWRRELRSPAFHQIAIANGSQEWQQNDGDYLPEWLRETATALIEPVPSLEAVLKQVDEADVKKLMGSTYYHWTEVSMNGAMKTEMGAGLAITDKTGLLFYGGGLGWCGLYHQYESFHGRMIARSVGCGSPEVTATVTTLEDLHGDLAQLFDVPAQGSSHPLLNTVTVDEMSLREHLLTSDAVVWPPIKDGPLEGSATTIIVVDRAGIVRQTSTIVTNNPAVNDAARQAIAGMRFSPYLIDGVPVQVVSRFSIPFKTTRPSGTETFDSAGDYFERGRRAGFPAAGTGPSYVLRAEFQCRIQSGTAETGSYTDTWKSSQGWRREATIAGSRYIRAQNGEQRYELVEGADAPLLRMILKFMEPIPAMDTFVESDWKIERKVLEDVKTIRVFTGYENPAGELDPQHARAFWFDDSGRLLKTYFQGLESRRSDFQKFDEIDVARRMVISKSGAVGLVLFVTDLSVASEIPDGLFDLPGHQWKRAFTEEVR